MGLLVENSAQADYQLRLLFCALIGSPYATVVAAGQDSGRLIAHCQALLKAHHELSDEAFASANEHLDALLKANIVRNQLVHNVWALGGVDAPTQLRTTRRSYSLSPHTTSVAEIEQLSQRYMDAGVQLHFWAVDNLGAESLSFESQLRWNDYVSGVVPSRPPKKTARRSKGSPNG